MQVARYEAGVVTKGNKLFVISGSDYKSFFLETSEVYDSISKKFTFIESNSNLSWTGKLFCTHYNDNKIVVVFNDCYCFYNINTNSWSKSTFLKLDKSIYRYSCVGLSKLIE